MKRYAGFVVLCFILVISIGANVSNIVNAQTCLSNDNDGDGYPELATDCSVIDCDDTDPAINPGETEIQYDGVDQNCDGTDAGYTIYGLAGTYMMSYDGEAGSLVRYFISDFHTFSKFIYGPDGYLYGMEDNNINNTYSYSQFIAYDVVTGEIVKIGGPFNVDTDLVFGPDGCLYGLIDTRIDVYDAVACASCLVNWFYPGIHRESRLAFGPDGNLYASYGQAGYLDGNIVNVINITTGEIVRSFPAEIRHTYGIAFGPDGYLYGYDDRFPGRSMKGYDPSNGVLMNSFPVEIDPSAFTFLIDSEGYLYVRDSSMIVIYNIQSGQMERFFYDGVGYLRSVALGPRLISGPATVRVDRLPYPVHYATIQEAYDNAEDWDEIQIQTGEFNEDINFNLSKTVFITGGFDGSFSNVIGATTINSTVSVNAGSLILAGGTLVIQ